MIRGPTSLLEPFDSIVDGLVADLEVLEETDDFAIVFASAMECHNGFTDWCHFHREVTCSSLCTEASLDLAKY